MYLLIKPPPKKKKKHLFKINMFFNWFIGFFVAHNALIKSYFFVLQEKSPQFNDAQTNTYLSTFLQKKQ